MNKNKLPVIDNDSPTFETFMDTLPLTPKYKCPGGGSTMSLTWGGSNIEYKKSQEHAPC
jgi:hypothetical protein